MDLNEDLVSIILPSYNGQKYIEKSIDSCLSQTYQNWELIIVNDASTDDTLKIANKYKYDARIKIIDLSSNLKLPGALNSGFKAAGGKYLTWTSDDNMYADNALEVMVGFIKRDPKCALVYSNYVEIDSESRQIRKVELAEPTELAAQNCIGACFLYRAEVAKLVGDYLKDLYLSEDYDYWMRMSIYGNFVRINKYLYYYRIHNDSLTNKNKKLINEATKKSLIKNLKKMKWLPKNKRAYGHFRIYKISGWNEVNIKILNLFYGIILSPKLFIKLVCKNINEKIHN